MSSVFVFPQSIAASVNIYTGFILIGYLGLCFAVTLVAFISSTLSLIFIAIVDGRTLASYFTITNKQPSSRIENITSSSQDKDESGPDKEEIVEPKKVHVISVYDIMQLY